MPLWRAYVHIPLLVIVLCAAVVEFNPDLGATLDIKREQLTFALFPSADRAYKYGDRHFGGDAQAYNLGVAESFYRQTALLDPAHPYVFHQLARVAFLRGDYTQALERIDFHIARNAAPHPSSYYMRGLIKGFLGDYAGAATDYETFLTSKPKSWAAINDYAWVLLKSERYREALAILDEGLLYSPENPWLHNSRATALYELGRYEEAYESAQRASRYVDTVTESEWLIAYPGNDPLIAREGVQAFRKAVEDNIHTIDLALKTSSKNMP